ncbi:MAG: hypothetical protein KIT87_09605 [Anaerolineae bacterium]|nr:hypothetical protein [Anaerolineae bacterium]
MRPNERLNYRRVGVFILLVLIGLSLLSAAALWIRSDTVPAAAAPSPTAPPPDSNLQEWQYFWFPQTGPNTSPSD